jgi:isopenicillin-N epimerase
MLPLDLKSLKADFYTGNFHKWVCTPKGSAFLFVKRSYQEWIRPVVISHGANSPRKDRSRFQIEFGWTGTSDVSSYLSVPESIRFFSQVIPGGWDAIRQRNRSLALAARQTLCQALNIPQPCSDSYIGSLAAIPIPDAPTQSVSPLYTDELQETLWRDHKIEVPIIPWPKSPQRLLRISAQLYNYLSQYESLAEVLKKRLERPIP